MQEMEYRKEGGRDGKEEEIAQSEDGRQGGRSTARRLKDSNDGLALQMMNLGRLSLATCQRMRQSCIFCLAFFISNSILLTAA